VLTSTDEVLEEIREAVSVEVETPSPRPSPGGRGNQKEIREEENEASSTDSQLRSLAWLYQLPIEFRPERCERIDLLGVFVVSDSYDAREA